MFRRGSTGLWRAIVKRKRPFKRGPSSRVIAGVTRTATVFECWGRKAVSGIRRTERGSLADSARFPDIDLVESFAEWSSGVDKYARAVYQCAIGSWSHSADTDHEQHFPIINSLSYAGKIIRMTLFMYSPLMHIFYSTQSLKALPAASWPLSTSMTSVQMFLDKDRHEARTSS